MIERVGTMCRLAPYNALDDPDHIIIDSEAVGRFRVVRMLQTQPFAMVSSRRTGRDKGFHPNIGQLPLLIAITKIFLAP